MRRSACTVMAIAALIGADWVSNSAQAAPRRPMPLRIVIDAHHQCWTYRGRFDGFIISAKQGDRLVISASGEAHFVNGGHEWAEVDPRDIVVSKGDLIVRAGKKTAQGAAVYSFAADGDYDLVLMPAAIEGMPSVVIVCRAPPDASLAEQ